MRIPVFLALMSLAGLVAGEKQSGALWLTKRVPGYVVSLSVEPQATPQGKGYPSHAGGIAHRLRIRIGARSRQDAVEVDGLALHLAEEGYAGAQLPVTRLPSAPQVEYEAPAVLRSGTNYRIVLRFRPADGTRIREATFDYRHHH